MADTERAVSPGAAPSTNCGFRKFLADLSAYFSDRNDTVEKLSTLFNFPPAKLERVKSNSLTFVRTLEEDGSITPTDISLLIKALESIGKGGMAQAISELFARNHPTSAPCPVPVFNKLQHKYVLLTNALKVEYKRRCHAVRPIPFFHDIWHNVNDIYVESKIESMDHTKQNDDPRRWCAITSRHEIFMKLTCEENITIEGEPGFGKSILLSQCAQDWNTSTADSPLKDVHIFILLRLRDVKGVSSISDAIRMLLPDDLPLTSEDINGIITSGHWKVMIAFDGYDEYSTRTARAEDDFVNRIIQGRILSACFIVVTTRPSCLPNLQNFRAKHFKLSGFDTGMQEKYIEKAILPLATTHEVKDTILSTLGSNAILSDICQAPFFFVTFAHMTSLSKIEKEFHSVTSYISFILACFFSHLESKNVPFMASCVQKGSNEDPTQRLKIAKLAFEAFNGKKQKLVWTRSHLLESLGPSCYNRYKEAGILLEEQHTSFCIAPGSQADNKVIATTYVRFFHKTFQEFYAAYHIAHLAENQGETSVKKAFTCLGLDNLQYILLFASGLRPAAARIVQDYLGTLGEDGRMFSVLCLLEQRGSAVHHTIERLCEKSINILPWDSKLLQRSKIQLFQLASERKIRIVGVVLTDCVQSVDLNEYSIGLSSGLKLPRLDTLQELKISFYLSTDLRSVARDILEYSGRCAALKMLKFFCFRVILLPFLFDKEVLASLQERNCKVKWIYSVGFEQCTRQLDLLSGRWTDEHGSVMTDAEYHTLVKDCEERGII